MRWLHVSSVEGTCQQAKRISWKNYCKQRRCAPRGRICLDCNLEAVGNRSVGSFVRRPWLCSFAILIVFNNDQCRLALSIQNRKINSSQTFVATEEFHLISKRRRSSDAENLLRPAIVKKSEERRIERWFNSRRTRTLKITSAMFLAPKEKLFCCWFSIKGLRQHCWPVKGTVTKVFGLFLDAAILTTVRFARGYFKNDRYCLLWRLIAEAIKQLFECLEKSRSRRQEFFRIFKERRVDWTVREAWIIHRKLMWEWLRSMRVTKKKIFSLRVSIHRNFLRPLAPSSSHELFNIIWIVKRTFLLFSH